MNVILIPFFLAANVVVNDTSEWTYGPEYLYNVNITTVIKSDSATSVYRIQNIQLISTMKCQPKAAENTLLCILQNSTQIMSLDEDNTTREIETEQIFEIKFNEQGVESVLVESPSNLESVDIIRKIAKQLSVDADMNRKIGVSQFMVRETTSFCDSETMYNITREELPETLETLDVTDGADFQLMVLPMVDGRPRTTLTIEKSRMGCSISPCLVLGFAGTLKMGRPFSKIYVDGLSGFETYTEMKDAELRVYVWKNIVSRIFAFNVLLSLDSIVPAQDPPPFVSNGELIDLTLNTDIPFKIIL